VERTRRLGLCLDLDEDEAGLSQWHGDAGQGYSSKVPKDEPRSDDDNAATTMMSSTTASASIN
jgi:hypothetical protein